MKTLLSVLVLSASLAGCAGTSGTQDSDTPMRKIAGAGSAVGRVVVNTALMAALDSPIPPITNAEPMDLDAWEIQLDRVTNTKQTLGSIEFLIDGEEYFSRLENVIASANDSIDVRTYIFDNDDYAVTVADKIKQRNGDARRRIVTTYPILIQTIHALYATIRPLGEDL